MFEKFKPKWDCLRAKLRGAKKSMTVLLIGAWQATVQNLDTIQANLPQVREFFGDNAMAWISGIFGALLLYVRVFHTKGPVEAKAPPKAEQVE